MWPLIDQLETWSTSRAFSSLNWGITRARTLDLASRQPYRHISDQSEEQKHPVSRGIEVTKTIGHPSSSSKLWVGSAHNREGQRLAFQAHTSHCNEIEFWLFVIFSIETAKNISIFLGLSFKIHRSFEKYHFKCFKGYDIIGVSFGYFIHLKTVSGVFKTS